MNMNNISTSDFFGRFRLENKYRKMKFLIAFALLAVASADVSHLSKKYLPPVHGGSSSVSYTPQYVQSAGVHYSAPQHHHQHVAPAPVNEYLPPVQETYSGPAVQTPAVSYGGPSYSVQSVGHSVEQSHSGRGVQQHYAGPSVQYSGHDVQQHYSGPSVQQHYSVPSVQYSGHDVQQHYSGPSVQQQYSVPSVHYSGQDVQYSGPAVQQSYGSSSGSYYGGSSGTQYASNGGYIYKKK